MINSYTHLTNGFVAICDSVVTLLLFCSSSLCNSVSENNIYIKN